MLCVPALLTDLKQANKSSGLLHVNMSLPCNRSQKCIHAFQSAITILTLIGIYIILKEDI